MNYNGFSFLDFLKKVFSLKFRPTYHPLNLPENGLRFIGVARDQLLVSCFSAKRHFEKQLALHKPGSDLFVRILGYYEVMAAFECECMFRLYPGTFADIQLYRNWNVFADPDGEMILDYPFHLSSGLEKTNNASIWFIEEIRRALKGEKIKPQVHFDLGKVSEEKCENPVYIGKIDDPILINLYVLHCNLNYQFAFLSEDADIQENQVLSLTDQMDLLIAFWTLLVREHLEGQTGKSAQDLDLLVTKDWHVYSLGLLSEKVKVEGNS